MLVNEVVQSICFVSQVVDYERRRSPQVQIYPITDNSSNDKTHGLYVGYVYVYSTKIQKICTMASIYK